MNSDLMLLKRVIDIKISSFPKLALCKIECLYLAASSLSKSFKQVSHKFIYQEGEEIMTCSKQFARVYYILENSITHWDEFKFKEPLFVAKSVQDLVKLDYYADWLVGFIMAEGSFGIKTNGSAFDPLKQSGDDNVNNLKAASWLITAEESRRIFSPGSKGAYQLSLTSVKNIEQVIYFFSSPDHHPLHSYKLNQHLNFISAIKRVNGIALSQLNLINKTLLDFKNEMYELAPQIYSLYLNLFLLFFCYF